MVGARPQFIKAATVSAALRDPAFERLEEVLVHTGQHFDYGMSAAFFHELGLPEPAANLEAGGGSYAGQLATMISGLERLFSEIGPDVILIYGDTTSTLATALVAARRAIPLAHVEAGLRSFRPGMAEEVNRVVADRLAQLLFCPTESAVAQLRREGRTEGVYFVGDVMYDSFIRVSGREDMDARRSRLGIQQAEVYFLATVHRAENTDDPQRLESVISALAVLSVDVRVVLPLHPRTQQALEAEGFAMPETILVLPPCSYQDMVALVAGAAVVLTDSGGVQKEAFFAGVPCVTLREETEWPETLVEGRNRLAGIDEGSIVEKSLEAASLGHSRYASKEFGTGDAARRILHILQQYL